MKTSAAHRLENPTPEVFLEEIHRILESGTLRGAREVAERGLALYPDHPELRQIHHALRPFEVRVSPESKISDPRPSYQWLKKNASSFRGKWVGLDKGELVTSADTFEEVRQALRKRDRRDTLIHFID